MPLVYHYNNLPLPKDHPDIGDFPSYQRANQFYQSRLSLCDCLPSGHKLKDNWKEIKIENHLNLQGEPKRLVSLSHTKGVGAAAMANKDNDCHSIGIDLEWTDRNIKEGMLKFFVNDDDDLNTYNDLELWSVKEAAFKAISPLLEDWPYERFVLKHIWVKENRFGLINNSDTLGKLEIHRENINDNVLMISLAILEKNLRL